MMLSATAASADPNCVADAFDAFSSIKSSGPFQYESRQVDDGSLRRETGKIVPGSAEHLIIHEFGTSPRREGIQVGGLIWTNDGLGWSYPAKSRRTILAGIPEFPFQIQTARCGQITALDGRKLNLFETELSEQEAVVQTLYVDAATDLPVRLEQTTDRASLKVTTYEFDPSISIAAPVIDDAQRREQSLLRFRRAAARSDPVCRARVLQSIARGNALGSYRFRVEGQLAAGISAISGTLVAPNALHYRLIGSSSYGGGNERIVVGSQMWNKVDRWSRAHPDTGYLSAFLSRALPGADFVGAVRCLSAEGATGLLTGYEYELYHDRGQIRELLEFRRVTVNAETGHPVMIESLDPHGNVIRTERRRYQAGLSVIAPTAAGVSKTRHAGRR